MDRLKRHIILWLLWLFKRATVAFIVLGMVSCVESFDIPTNTEFDDVLIVEGTLTDVSSIQTIDLSRTGTLGDDNIVPEQNAQVRVNLGNGSAIDFVEVSPGKYESAEAFAATNENTYTLSIISTDGNTYTSTEETLPPSATLDEVIARRIVNENNIEGVEIVVNSSSPSGEAQFFRYTFQEDFEVVAPLWNQFEAIVVSEDPPEVDIQLRPQEELFCFGTNSSNRGTLFSTAGLNTAVVSELPVHFLERDNYFIARRYSILVKQMVQTEEAFTFYQKLRELSGQENLLTQQQPGFLSGNMLVNDAPSREVTGYFDVVSISEKRIFFNHEDFFDRVGLPAYAVNCNDNSFSAPRLSLDRFGNSELILAIQNERLEYFTDNSEGLGMGAGPDPDRPFKMVPRICGDCTRLGSNVKPDFWID
ncbi:MAG: DUF4249 domain-containing protein [Bacteroidota bacterium]